MSGLTQVSLFLQVAVQMGTPILFGTLGGILCEKSGNINLGVEGMMLMGAVFGFMTALHTGNPFLTIAVAGLAGAFGALIYAVITVTLRGNHTVTGLALTIFGTGLFGTLGGLALPNSILRAFSAYNVPGLSKIPVLGEMFFQQSVYVQIAPVLAVLLYIYLTRTYAGLSTRAVGENPGAADAARLSSTLISWRAAFSAGWAARICRSYSCRAGRRISPPASAGSPSRLSSFPPGTRPKPFSARISSARCAASDSSCKTRSSISLDLNFASRRSFSI